MSELPEKEKQSDIRNMFAQLAQRYRAANRWLTWGQDANWRREVIDRAHLASGSKLLDIGTGTGDLAFEAVRREGQVLAVGADFTPQMIEVGRSQEGGDLVRWLNTDAQNLPFGEETFDAVVCGYLLRNVVNVDQALAEQFRVMRPGGRLVCLDTTPPPDDFAHLPVKVYLRFFIPVIGWLVTGNFKAYQYLPHSTMRFINAKELANRMMHVGFKNIQYRIFMGASMAIHWGSK